MGRTKRVRSRKKRQCSHPDRSEKSMISLMKFMGAKGFSPNNIRVANFEATGRGMMALKTFSKDDLLISLPRTLLIGVKQAMLLSKWASSLHKFCTYLSSVQILCVFLLEGRYRASKGNEFSLSSYIESLPEKFHHHIFWSDEILSCLPRSIRNKANIIKVNVQKDYRQLKESIPQEHEIQKYLNWDLYRWAWCCINSRCIYSNHEKIPNWKFLVQSDADQYYLAPFLDMFNHSPQARVVGSYNHKKQSYEIVSLQKWKKYEQVFICYGPHSTEGLFLEYGFVYPGENVNDVVPIPRSILHKCDDRELCNSCADEFENFLQKQKLVDGQHIEKGKLSFNAKMSVTLYTALLSKCVGKHVPNSISKGILMSTFLMVQNDRLSKMVKTRVDIAESKLMSAMHDIIYADFARARDTAMLEQWDHLKSEFSDVQDLFKVLLCNVSPSNMRNYDFMF